jgi:integration host factor subunit beta
MKPVAASSWPVSADSGAIGAVGSMACGRNFMTRAELIEVLARKRSNIPYNDVEQTVKTLLEQMSESLARGERIEIRGFGSFSLHFRSPRVGRNPKTGEAVTLDSKYVPHFKPGKELRERVNERLGGHRFL